MTRVAVQAIALACLLLLHTGCPEDDKPPPPGRGEGEGEANEGEGEGEGEVEELPAGCVGNPIAETTFGIYQAMSPLCLGCHGPATTNPYFVSFAAFTNGIVQDRGLVVPGDPGASLLLPMLRGEGVETLEQMPLGGEPYAERAPAGASMADLEAWITALPPGGVACDAVDCPENQRLPADVFTGALAHVLGYTLDEVLEPYCAPDYVQASDPNAVDFFECYATRKADRFLSLGGPDWIAAKGRNNTLTRSFQLEVTQMALGHCRRAIIDDNQAALFRVGSRDTGMADAATVSDNIAYLHLRFLSEPADSEDLDGLLQLFDNTEQTGSATEGWIAVCAALVRDPLFLLY